MAFLENLNVKYRIEFRLEGRQYSRSLKTSSDQKDKLAKGQVERNLELVSLGLLEVPDDCDVFNFFLTGKAQEKPDPEARVKLPDPAAGFAENFSPIPFTAPPPLGRETTGI